MANVVKRHQNADFLNVGNSETPEYVLMGTGFTSLDEKPGAKTESVKYIHEVTSTSSVVSYESQFPFEAEQIADEKAIDALYKVGRNHLVGVDCEFDYIRAELWNPVENAENTYAARKFRVSAEISDFKGENKMTMSGNLNAVGDPIDGTFNISTKTFTATEG